MNLITIVENTNDCTKYDIQQIINDFKETGRNKTKSKKAEIEFYDDLIKKIEKEFTENYDVSKLDNGNDEVINTERMKVIFTTPQNQKNNILYFAFFSVYLLLIRHKKIKYKKFNK